MEINQVTTIFLAIALLLIGTYLIRKIKFLDKFSIPAPVIGGLLFAFLVFILNEFKILEITMDTSLQELFMLMFFTTVGLGASYSLIKAGGKLMLIYLVAVGFLSLIQNIVGVAGAMLFNLHPLIGVMAGSPSMFGGHGGAAAFGETFEAMGVEGALTAGLASATFGLIAGGLIGGPIARYLINKNKLKHQPEQEIEESIENEAIHKQENKKSVYSPYKIFIQLGIITFSMSLGAFLGEQFSDLTGFVLPSYVGAMFVAIIVRSIIDLTRGSAKIDFDVPINDLIGSVSLGIFLSMALMSIKLWEVIDLALPLVVILVVQMIIITLFAIFVVFKMLGKNYDAAVMMGGLAGHGLGATPTAMANMDTITQKFGSSRQAFLIVPIVGAFLIDTINLPIIVFFMNYFG